MSEFDVSIHALLAECDFSGMECAPPVTGFNPRTPCGVRHAEAAYEVTGWLFQSTHSLRSATILIFSLAICQKVSIHALLAECDACALSHCSHATGFNPRTPCGVRLACTRAHVTSTQFQSTHSLRSATDIADIHTFLREVSIHALLAECDCAQPYTLLLNKANHTLRQPP